MPTSNKKEHDMTDNHLDTVKELAAELLEKLSIKSEVEGTMNEEGSVEIDIETEESGLLIGYHGEMLNSFQLILSMLVYKKLGVWVRTIVNVGDYREKREESIKSLALRVASEVSLSKKPVALPYLVPFERRIVHMTLADHPDVVSVSEGENKERRVVVKPKDPRDNN